MAETFNYNPTIQSQKNNTPRVKRQPMGNGYFQITGDGINSNLEKWNLTFIVNDTDKQAIISFFETTGGYTYFNWTSDEIGAVEKQYIVPNWTLQPIGGNWYNINCMFEEFPGLTI